MGQVFDSVVLGVVLVFSGGYALRTPSLSIDLTTSLLYLGLGGGLVWFGCFAKAKDVSKSLESGPRVRWGAALAIPGALLLLGSAVLGRHLPHGLTVVAVLSLVLGAAILFFDLP